MKDEKQKGTNVFAAAMQKTKELGEKAAENAKAVGRKVADGAKAGAEAAAQGAAELGKKVADGAKAGADAAAQGWAEMTQHAEEAAKQRKARAADAAWQRDMAKYNPLFEKVYRDPSYTRPNIIMIRDDAERRSIEVCEDAMGWTETQNGVEVLCLYDEMIEQSGVTFVPAAECNAIYYIDKFDTERKCYINVAHIFERAQKAKAAELCKVAECLGAKKCTIELEQAEEEMNKKQASGGFHRDFGMKAATPVEGAGVFKAEASSSEGYSLEGNVARGNRAQMHILDENEWEGNNEPQYPELKWFKNDDVVLGLIDARINGKNAIKKKTFRISCKSTATMDANIAAAIDSTMQASTKLAGASNSIGGGAGVKASVQAQAMKDTNSTLLFHIEF